MIGAEERPQPKRSIKMRAIYQGYDTSGIKKGDIVDIYIEPMVFGQPIKMLSPFDYSYPTAASFNKTWQTVEPKSTRRR